MIVSTNFCDHCGKEIEFGKDYIHRRLYLQDNIQREVDLCSDCYWDLFHLIRDFVEKEEKKKENKEMTKTAKEILQGLYDQCFELKDPYGDSDEIKGCVTPEDIKWYAGTLGVEVEE